MQICLRAAVLPALTVLCLTAQMHAASVCVNHSGTKGCSSSIQAAVTSASAGDTIHVSDGTYNESVTISKSLSLIADGSVTINATGRATGISVDGTSGVFIQGFTVRNANFEGILIKNAFAITLKDNVVMHNDLALDINTPACPGLPPWETAESEDCGEGIHLVAVDHSVISGNLVQNNAGGILMSDETGPTYDNVITGNTVRDNPYDCGITLAGHPHAGDFGVPRGVYRNVIDGNHSEHNGYQVPGAGAGVGIFAFIPGANMSGNVVSHNVLNDNGIPGVTIHAHVPRMNFDDTTIVRNTIFGNGADNDPDATTTGTAGINIGGTSTINGLVITGNRIWGEQIDIDINLLPPSSVLVTLNKLLGNGMGVVNGGTGSVDAIANWWGCDGGPGMKGCSSVSPGTPYTPWLTSGSDDRDDH